MQCDCDYVIPKINGIEEHYDNCSSKREHPGQIKHKNTEIKSLQLQNDHLKKLDSDVLYHLGLDTHNYDLPALFGDVKFVCMGGTKYRMREFAAYMGDVLGIQSVGKLINLTKHSHRYAMYKVGPVLSVSHTPATTDLYLYKYAGLLIPLKKIAVYFEYLKRPKCEVDPALGTKYEHGIGIPSMTVLLQELIKLMFYAKAKDPIFVRIGTCGGLGIPPGSVVISSCGVNGTLEKSYDIPVLGQIRKLPSYLDKRLSQELKSQAADDDQFNTYIAATMAADDFYRGQARLDGPFCDYTEEEKLAFLQKLSDLGVRNIEMEVTAFAALTREAGARAADVCVTLVNRLVSDQVTPSKSTMLEWQKYPMMIVGRFISKCVQSGK